MPIIYSKKAATSGPSAASADMDGSHVMMIITI